MKTSNNIILHSCNKGADLLTPILLIPIVTRNFGTEDFGLYSIITSLFTMSLLLVDWDCSLNGTSTIAKTRSDVRQSIVFFRRLSLRISISLLIIACVLVGVQFASLSEEHILFVYFYVGALVFQSFNASWFFAGRQTFLVPLVANLICKGLYLAGVLLLVVFQSLSELYLIGVLFFCSNAALAIFYFANVIKTSSAKLYWPRVKELLQGMSVFLTNVLYALYGHSGILFVGFYMGMASAGVFSVSYKIPALIVALFQPVNQVMFSLLAKRSAEGGSSETLKLFNQWFWSILLLSSICCAVYLALSEFILTTILNIEFDFLLSIVLTIAVFFSVCSSVSTFTLISLGKQALLFKFMLCVAVIIGLAFVVTIFTNSLVTVALGMAMSQLVLFILSFIAASRSLGGKNATGEL